MEWERDRWRVHARGRPHGGEPHLNAGGQLPRHAGAVCHSGCDHPAHVQLPGGQAAEAASLGHDAQLRGLHVGRWRMMRGEDVVRDHGNEAPTA